MRENSGMFRASNQQYFINRRDAYDLFTNITYYSIVVEGKIRR